LGASDQDRSDRKGEFPASHNYIILPTQFTEMKQRMAQTTAVTEAQANKAIRDDLQRLQ